MKAEVEWFICRADAGDVKFWTTEAKKSERVPDMKVGDELWRVALSIGPVSVDHNHWAGDHLTGTPAQMERIAHLISNDPDFPEADDES